MSVNAICVWDFTCPVTSIKKEELVILLKDKCKKWCFQQEMGEESKYEHFQGRVSFKLKTRKPTTVIKFDGFHWSPTSNENSDNDFYVCDEDTRVAGPWKDTDKVFYIPRQIREVQELYNWQKCIIEDAKHWDTRHINILYDPNGNNGKSILKTYIGCHQIGRSLPFTNDYRDIMRMVMDTEKKSLYIIDIPRALKKDQLFQFFSAVETLKDGYAYDDRYNFKEEYFDCPNIWIFMNTVPSVDYLSKDRWKFWRIDEDKDLVKLDPEEIFINVT